MIKCHRNSEPFRQDAFRYPCATGLFVALWLVAPPMASAQPAAAQVPEAMATPVPTQPASNQNEPKFQKWNWHFQDTDIVQGDSGFPARYSGPASLNSQGEVQETVTMDLYGGLRLGHDTELHVDALLWQGFGLSHTYGIEAFPNGDAYKVGTQFPKFMFSHLFIRKTIGLGGPRESVPDDQLTLASKQDIKRVTVTIGRMSLLDIFDHNTYAQDPHAQFLNWAMEANMAWDYGQDSVGYAPAFAVELNQPKWALRYGIAMEPRDLNGYTGDDEYLMAPSRGAFGPLLKAWAMMTEFERRYSVKAHPGAIRFMPWLNEADMAPYSAATAILEANGPGANIAAAQTYTHKYGFGLNWEQEVAKNVGVFSRLGWNDGHEEAWTFTDANSSASLGASVKGDAWHRPGDTIGIAGVVSAASSDQQKFLEAGGQGIYDGDGALTYGPEQVLETYYNRQIGKNVHGTLDYQFIKNPAFNRARGPVSVFGVRLHYEF